ncbi:unnamed protein product [Ectocarpus sp. 6 AP-2014]
MASRATPTAEEIDAVYSSAQAAISMNMQAQPFIPGQRWQPSTSNNGGSHSRGAGGQAQFHVETCQTGRGTIRRHTTPSLTSKNEANSVAKMPTQSSTPVAGNDEEDSRAIEPVIAAEMPVASNENTLGGSDVAHVAGLIEESKDEEGETAAVASSTESSSSSPTGGDGRHNKWKGIHIGVWLAVGAGVAVGAALWSRRR